MGDHAFNRDGADAEDRVAFGYESEDGSDEDEDSPGRALRIGYEAARRLEMHHIAMAPRVSDMLDLCSDNDGDRHVSYLGRMEEILEGSMDYPVCIFPPDVPTGMCKMEAIALAMITETKICEQCKEEATGDCEGGLCTECCRLNRCRGNFQCCDGGYGSSSDEVAALMEIPGFMERGGISRKMNNKARELLKTD